MLLHTQDVGDVGDGANTKAFETVSVRIRCRFCFSWCEQQFACLLYELIVCAGEKHVVDRGSGRRQPYGEWPAITLHLLFLSF